MFPLIIGNIVVWSLVSFLEYRDRSQSYYPCNPNFDGDMDALWLAPEIPIPVGYTPILEEIPDKDEDRLIKTDFEKWLSLQSFDESEEERLIKEGILEPDGPTVVWVEGEPLQIGNPNDLKRWKELKRKALTLQIFNSKNLSEGGKFDLDVVDLMFKGFSKYGAERALALGANPKKIQSLEEFL